MAKYKYVNMNPYPIHLPDNRGGQVMFREGEGTTREWYSRLCGPRQLTRVLIPGTGPATPPPKVVKPVIRTIPQPQDVNITPKAQPVQKPLEIFKQIDGDGYTVNKGIYSCKLCDIFRTGSSNSMKAHLEGYHKREPVVAKPIEINLGQGEGEGEKVVASSLNGVPVNTKDNDKETVMTSMPREVEQPKAEAVTAPQVIKAEAQQVEFACTHQGCLKSFKTERALKMHTTRAHGG